VIGDAFLAADLASQVGRYPAALDDALVAYEALLDNGTPPRDIALVGESVGDGRGLVMSPYADSPCPGRPWKPGATSTRCSAGNLQTRAADYLAGQDAALALISPVFADLSCPPPLLIQAGTHEVLLDDALSPPTTSRHSRCRGHARHRAWGAPRLPGCLLPDP
jgi:epsilon-lactone hydrolase